MQISKTRAFRSFDGRFLAKSIYDGVASRLRRRNVTDARAQSNAVRRYYLASRGSEKVNSIIDTNTVWYRDFVLAHVPFDNLAGCNILEIGSGSGTVLVELARRGVLFGAYTGVDLVGTSLPPDLASGLPKISLITADVCDNKLVGQLPSSEFSHIIAINVLSYVKDISSIPILTPKAVCSQDGKLFAVEPYPSLFWEKRFGDVEVFLRYPSRLLEGLAFTGWVPVGIRVVYAFRVFGFYVWPLAYGVECTSS
jgi:SAM-dependent methyltransferase